jgi:6-phosphofructokinase 1
VDNSERVLACRSLAELAASKDAGEMPPSFERAGPRQTIFYGPRGLICGIVTCGGLCPGLNDVIRSIVLTLTHAYGVKRVLGFRYGYEGLSEASQYDPIELTPEAVGKIHEHGGTILGSSRGPQDPAEMVQVLQQWGVSILFAIGGDGTLRGASAIAQEALKQELPISVIGIPKTIDNDLEWIVQSFGFSTAVEEARRNIFSAHTEAMGALGGIGLLKLMGRHSGFIAAAATLSCPDVNYCLVPEVPFKMEGDGGFLACLERRLAERRHAVVVVAEGAAQDILQDPANQERDASGNLRLKDVGLFLRDRMKQYLSEKCVDFAIKYIDPSYAIRSLPANALDSQYCLQLGQRAVHAGMTGRTDMLVGYWNTHFTHVPIYLAVAERKMIDPQESLWQSVLETTGQGTLGATGQH